MNMLRYKGGRDGDWQLIHLYLSASKSSHHNSTLLEKVRIAMAKDSPLNIFYAAAKSKKPVSSSSSEGKATKIRPVVPVRNFAIEAMLERMNDMRKEIDDKLEALMTNSGVSKERLQQYLSNPSNFTNEQWEFLQQKNEELSQKIWNSVEAATGEVSEVNTQANTKVEAKVDTRNYHESSGPASTTSLTGRKSKFSGSRRNWISTG